MNTLRISPRAPESGLDEAREVVQLSLQGAADELSALGTSRPALDGKMLRPLVAYLSVPEGRREELDRRFWMGALAVEMAHEASLLHDDILDEAPERRGRPTLVADAGVGPALVLGDHLLTSSYRAAAQARSSVFLETFINAVERTVAGELAQEKGQGRILGLSEYRTIVTRKSGELFRSVFALPPALLGVGDPERVGELGSRLGCFYQMVDDFLDYCTEVDRGKIPLQDYHQSKWTWPLGLIGVHDFLAPERDVLERLFCRSAPDAPSPMELGARQMESEINGILEELRAEGMATDLLSDLFRGWIRQLHVAAERGARAGDVTSGPPTGITPRQDSGSGHREELVAAVSSLEGASDWLAYFGKHAKSFRFASHLFPPEALRQVAGVYAFCRFTDDLVDEARETDPVVLSGRLAAWRELAREAHQGRPTGIPLLDEVIGETGKAGVPFHYIDDLVEGVRMDLTPRTYASLGELREYSYRVASVVGGWLTELFGVRDPRILERAFALGHAMQLTNILRDVGEDLRQGRLYLPLDRMEKHGVDQSLLETMARERESIFPGYRALMEELMAEADADYEGAFQAIPALPPFFQRPVAVAARVYQGIHREIRRNGYDNLTRRASTSLIRKLGMGAGALWSLRRIQDPVRAEAQGLGVSSGGLGSEESQGVVA